MDEDEERRQHHFRVGIFAVAALACLAALLFALGGRKLFQPTYTFETYFDRSVNGLEVGAPLRYRGVPLGQVSEILPSAVAYEGDVPLARRRNYIIVRAKVNQSALAAIQVRKDRPAMIARGLRAQTQLAGISGQQYLALDYIEPPDKYPSLPFDWTPEYDYLPSVPSVTTQIVENAQAFMAKLNQIDVKRIGNNLDQLLAKLDTAIDQLQVAELSADARRTLKTTTGTLARLDQQLANPALKQGLDNIASITASLRGVTERGDLDHLISRLDETAARLNGLMADNQYDARLIVQDLRVTADNLRELSTTIKRYPAGALLGGPPKKVRVSGAPQ